MKAIILSAGQGKRLLPLTERAPKCMLPVRGRPLIGRQIDALLRCGVDDITVVVGFGAESVEAGLAERYGPRRIRTLYNPFFAITDNLVSCWVARAEMEKRVPAAERRHAVRGCRARAAAGGAGASDHARRQPQGTATTTTT